MYSGDGDCEILGLSVRKCFIWEKKKAVISDLAGMQAFLSIIIYSRTIGGRI